MRRRGRGGRLEHDPHGREPERDDGQRGEHLPHQHCPLVEGVLEPAQRLGAHVDARRLLRVPEQDDDQHHQDEQPEGRREPPGRHRDGCGEVGRETEHGEQQQPGGDVQQPQRRRVGVATEERRPHEVGGEVPVPEVPRHARTDGAWGAPAGAPGLLDGLVRRRLRTSDQPGASEDVARQQHERRCDERRERHQGVREPVARTYPLPRPQIHRDHRGAEHDQPGQGEPDQPQHRTRHRVPGLARRRGRRVEGELRRVDQPERHQQQPERLAPRAGREPPPVVALDGLPVPAGDLRPPLVDPPEEPPELVARHLPDAGAVQHALRRSPAHPMDTQLDPGVGHVRTPLTRATWRSTRTRNIRSGTRRR